MGRAEVPRSRSERKNGEQPSETTRSAIIRSGDERRGRLSRTRNISFFVFSFLHLPAVLLIRSSPPVTKLKPSRESEKRFLPRTFTRPSRTGCVDSRRNSGTRVVHLGRIVSWNEMEILGPTMIRGILTTACVLNGPRPLVLVLTRMNERFA